MARYVVKGTQFWWTISSVLTQVAQIRTIRRAGSNQVIDVTALTDTARQKLVDIWDEGQVTLELIFDPVLANHTALLADGKSGTSRVARIIWSDTGATQRNFTAFVVNFEEGGTLGEGLMASVTLEITDAVT